MHKNNLNLKSTARYNGKSLVLNLARRMCDLLHDHISFCLHELILNFMFRAMIRFVAVT